MTLAFIGASTSITWPKASMAAEQRSYFEQATDALERALQATHVGEQAAALEEALRLSRRALAEERAKLDRIAAPSASNPARAK